MLFSPPSFGPSSDPFLAHLILLQSLLFVLVLILPLMSSEFLFDPLLVLFLIVHIILLTMIFLMRLLIDLLIQTLL